MKTRNGILQRLNDMVELIVSSYRARKGDPDAWERTIEKFEIQDRLHPPQKNSVLFIGSSSINFWGTLETDMAPFPVINRGFGGSYMRDVAKYVDRIVLPYEPRAVVLFAGTNDITVADPELAQTVFSGYQEFVQRVHAARPDVPIYYIAITPTPTRWNFWPIAQEANALIQEHALTDQRLHFINLTHQLIGKDGRPDRRFYRLDGIHPNTTGYAVWTQVIKSQLEADLQKAERR